MHKNYRRKNPRHCPGDYWPRGMKQNYLKQRVKRRRQRDRMILRETVFEEDAWEEIRKFEVPVDWWEMD